MLCGRWDDDDQLMMTMLMVFGACHVASTPLRVVVVVAIGAHCPIYTTKSSSKGRSADFLCLSTKEWTPYLYTKIQFLGVRDTRLCIRLHVMGMLAWQWFSHERGDRRTDVRYQLHYLPHFAVDNNTVTWYKLHGVIRPFHSGSHVFIHMTLISFINQ